MAACPACSEEVERRALHGDHRWQCSKCQSIIDQVGEEQIVVSDSVTGAKADGATISWSENVEKQEMG